MIGSKRFFLWAAVSVAVVQLAGMNSQARAENWSLYTPNPTPLTSVKDMQAVVDSIDKETNGDLKIRIHLGGTLQIQPANLTQAVSDGVLQIGDDQQFGGNVPIGGLLRLPSLIRTEAEYAKAAEILMPYVRAAYKKFGVTVLATYYYPPLVIFSKPSITSLADIKGRKIRTLSAESSEWVKRMGGLPITLSFAETAPAIERGLVDGTTTASSGAGYVLKDLVKYEFFIPIAFSNVYVIASDAAIDKLKPATRDVLLRTFKDVMDKTSAKIAKDEVDLTEKMVAGGMTYTKAKPEEIAAGEKEMSAYWESWAKDKGPEAIEALGKIRTAIGR